jgi:alpha-D-ribose 1-methylphosphonate 5-triphosphate synthase subunit PhnL
MHEIAGPMLEAAQGIHVLAEPMLETGTSATKAAEEARDAVLRTNELIERTLKLVAPGTGAGARRAHTSRWRRRGNGGG